MALVFKVTGTKNGKKFQHTAKIGGGNMTEKGLVDHYRAVKHKDYIGVTDLKGTYIGNDAGEAAIDEQGQPIPPGEIVENGASSSAPVSDEGEAQ